MPVSTVVLSPKGNLMVSSTESSTFHSIWNRNKDIPVNYHNRRLRSRGGGGSSIVKVPGDVPPTRVYFFGPLV